MTAPISFENQVVIITGAGGGLGGAYAREIARRGGAVVANDLGGEIGGGGASTGYADAVVADILAAGGKAVANYDSVADPDGAQRIIQTALDHFGHIDTVIANAGTIRVAPFDETSLADLDALHAVHVGGTFNMAKAAWPHMKAQGHGRFVLTTSSAGMLGVPGLSAYGAAKGGIAGLLHALSEEGRPHGISCNALMPNAVSRMAMASAGVMGDNPWIKTMLPTFDPAYVAGIATWLAHPDCQSTHAIYSAAGGRIARVFVGAAKGWHGPIETPPSVEDVAAHFDQIRDDTLGYAIPAAAYDEFRIVAEGRT